MTSDIPYPFSAAQAMGWLRPVRGEVRFAIELDGQLIGGAGYYRRPSGVAELGFWLGRPWWGQGYATEAARAVVGTGSPTRAAGLFLRSLRSTTRLPPGCSPSSASRPWAAACIACAARGHDVEVVTYWLDRQRARLAEPPPGRGRVATALARLARPARRYLRAIRGAPPMKFLDQAKIYIAPATAATAASLSGARSSSSSAGPTAATAARAATCGWSASPTSTR